MGMRSSRSRLGRSPRQIVCRRPTPQPGQRFSSITAAAGPAGDETNDPTSAGTTSNIKTANTQTAIREGDANLGSTSDGAGPLLFGDRLLLLDSQLSLAGGGAVSEAARLGRVASLRSA
jgi:hypothetical protein